MKDFNLGLGDILNKWGIELYLKWNPLKKASSQNIFRERIKREGGWGVFLVLVILFMFW